MYLLRVVAVSGLVLLSTAAQARDVSKSEVCAMTSEKQIASLFDRWNASLQTGEPKKVVANYSDKSILLPTLSNKPRLSPAEKEDYFKHFLEHKPVGSIDSRSIEVNCNSAVDSGLYSFKFDDGSMVKARYTFAYKWDGKQWLISSHHSSAMPEKN